MTVTVTVKLARRCIGLPESYGPARTCRRRVPFGNRWRCGSCDREIIRRQQLAANTLGLRRRETV